MITEMLSTVYGQRILSILHAAVRDGALGSASSTQLLPTATGRVSLLTDSALQYGKHVFEHIAAISCVSGVELLSERFAHAFGWDLHKWPVWIWICLLGIAYAVGFVTARYFMRRTPRAKSPVHKVSSLAPAMPPHRGGGRWDGVTAAGIGTVIAIAGILWWKGRRRERS